MTLPFTVEQFYAVFRGYNAAVWPAQVVLVALAMVAIGLVAMRRGAARWRHSDVAVAAILTFLWAWLALVYHLAFFATINPLAYAFAGVSLAGAGVLLWHGVIRRRLVFGATQTLRGVAGVALIAFSLVGYPLWAIAAGHPWPDLPTFGLPCPTTLFTVGMLALLAEPYPKSVLVVPVLWSLVGAQAAFLLDVQQDLSLIAGAAIGLWLIVRRQGAKGRDATPPLAARARRTDNPA